jgi:hypothetical protein
MDKFAVYVEETDASGKFASAKNCPKCGLPVQTDTNLPQYCTRCGSRPWETPNGEATGIKKGPGRKG